MDEDFDIFVSYAHHDMDDGSGALFSGVIETLQQEHGRFSPDALRVFFDRDAIILRRGRAARSHRTTLRTLLTILRSSGVAGPVGAEDAKIEANQIAEIELRIHPAPRRRAWLTRLQA